MWLSHVKEARPVYRHGWRIATLIVALPITGAIGWGLLAWMRRADRELLRRVLAAAAARDSPLPLLLLWQTRTGPAAQMMATTGAAALVWFLLPPLWTSKYLIVRVSAAVLVVAGVGAGARPLVLSFIPEPKPTAREKAIGHANHVCGSLWGCARSRSSPREWCSPSSIRHRG